MMRWEKRGRIFVPDGTRPWMHHMHRCRSSTNSTRRRCGFSFLSCRDDENRSRIASIDLAASDPLRVLGTAPEPLLPLGQRGTFDDKGMMPSCIVADGQLRYLYYIGWNPQVTVSYRVAIGLAVSEDGGVAACCSSGPLLDRDRDEPFFNTTPCVVRGRDRLADVVQPVPAGLKLAAVPSPCTTSSTPRPMMAFRGKDGDRVHRLSCRNPGHWPSLGGAVRGLLGMWFSYRGLVDYRTDPRTSYGIGYAESRDGLHWDRKPDPAGLERSAEGWDSVMMAYTHILRTQTRGSAFTMVMVSASRGSATPSERMRDPRDQEG